MLWNLKLGWCGKNIVWHKLEAQTTFGKIRGEMEKYMNDICEGVSPYPVDNVNRLIDRVKTHIENVQAKISYHFTIAENFFSICKFLWIGVVDAFPYMVKRTW